MLKPREFLKNELIAVLCGGRSGEREISLKTGHAVDLALKNAGYKTVLLDAGENVFDEIRKTGARYAFIALHGPYGEDGTIQGGLEMMNVKYTGCGVLSSALAMDKHMSKKIMCSCGIPTPDWQLFTAGDYPEIMKKIKYPAVLKPRSSGSGLGVEIIDDVKDFDEAFEKIKNLSRYFIAEEYIRGVELTVGFIGRRILPVIEIVPKNRFYDYESKYAQGGSEHIIPARIPAQASESAKILVERCITEFGLSVMSRIDIMLSPDGSLYVLEINTIPGMTETSLLPDAARASGIDFTEMVLLILDESFGM